jgi:uncharacterized repeat protein (TIGR03803 family)
MRSSKSSLNLHRIAFFAVFVLARQSFAQFHENVVYKFAGSPDGSRPAASLVADAAGNLFGTTADGGIQFSCCGTIFELSPPATAGGSWSETVLYQFQGGSDGSSPLGTLIFDKLGNLYGTTSGTSGTGSTAFELSPPSIPGGAWTKTTLTLFTGSTLPGPTGKLVMDPAGNLYGTSLEGGSHNKGLVFELVPPKTAGAIWAKRVLYEFGAFAHDGSPAADLLLRGGILYGTTEGGGTANQGTVFSLTREPGLWTETILHSFTGSEGEGPRGGLIMDGAGNLFGTAQGTNTSLCDTSIDCGAIYELSPPAVAGDLWQETTLFRFSSLSTGADPYAALWRNAAGVLYGTTIYGGNGGNNGRNLGTVFKLVPPAIAGGDWTEVVLHYFRGTAVGDGALPSGALILSNGVFYGTTEGGGDGNGTVFSLSFAP